MRFAFPRVPQAALTVIQQVLAGDSWGLMTLSVIHEAPWTLLFFLLVLFTINLVVVNLILAVVVDKATNVYEQESRNIIREQALSWRRPCRGRRRRKSSRFWGILPPLSPLGCSVSLKQAVLGC